MKNQYIKANFIITGKFTLLCMLALTASCDDFINIDPPRTALIRTTVFDSDATANSAMMNIYDDLSGGGFASGGSTSISFFGSYSSDEQINFSIAPYQEFNDNELTPENQFIASLWGEMYKTIYNANAIIEGVAEPDNITPALKMQLEGEAKFMRAFCHFYLVNLFGDIPVVTSTDYRVNTSIPRSSAPDVYQQIVRDLKDAQSLLPSDYQFAFNERVRANKYAATALLARAYLFMSDWTNAEGESAAVIANSGLYSLKDNLEDVFAINSTEAILQWWSDFRPSDWVTFSVLNDPPFFGAMRPEFATSFEAGDLRGSTWIGMTDFGYYEARKYSLTPFDEPTEYSTVLRLAEQYLIRAEARTQLGNFAGAQEDINVVRKRAKLPDTPANDKASLLVAIEQERKAELFTEWGHRWLDLKRMDRADAILVPIKGGMWQVTDRLYPIPQSQIMNDPAMIDAQNPGY